MSEQNETEQAPAVVYNDDDLVYVNPKERIVVGKVEWTANGKPKSLAMPTEEEEHDEEKPQKGKGRPRKQRYYPWGTYRSMKRLFKIDGHRQAKPEAQKTLDEVMEKALNEPFWNS